MSDEKTVVKTSGISLSGAVFLVFLVMKLTGHIAWSWWWVTSPLWLGMAFVLGLLLLAVAFGAFFGVLNAIFGK